MQEAFDWQMRVMEIRKNPSLATEEDIRKLADDFFYSIYSRTFANNFAEGCTNLAQQNNPSPNK